MPTQIVMDHTGDSRHVFDRQDAEALARAKQRFQDLTGQGFTAAVREVEGQSRLVESIALKRLGMPSDIANAVLFFASDLAGWITGQVLGVDGGK